jgi:hypothetical protein
MEQVDSVVTAQIRSSVWLGSVPVWAEMAAGVLQLPHLAPLVDLVQPV